MTTESGSSVPRRKWLPIAGVMTATAGILGAVLFTYLPSFQPPLDEKRFRSFLLESKEPISSTSSIFNLVPSSASGPPGFYERQFRQGVWSVQVKQPQLQIARAYTPLPPLYVEQGNPNPHVLRFLIRHDPKGEVSSYLHRLSPGSKIELRGPQIEYELPKNVEEVVFIAGGTGIAPALQVVHALYDLGSGSPVGPGDSFSRPPPRIRVLWANRRREDCIGGPSVLAKPTSVVGRFFTSGNVPSSGGASMRPASPLVRHLQQLELQHPERFSVGYFVDDDRTLINEQVLKQSLEITQRKGGEVASGTKLILVSGPEGFINYVAGPKRWVGGREVQGELGGLLSRIDHSGWEVSKL